MLLLQQLAMDIRNPMEFPKQATEQEAEFLQPHYEAP
jgi:hypothetical protein